MLHTLVKNLREHLHGADEAPKITAAVLGYLRCFTAGAIVSSLAVDVFPRGFKADHRFSGLASVLGVIVAVAINRIVG